MSERTHPDRRLARRTRRSIGLVRRRGFCLDESAELDCVDRRIRGIPAPLSKCGSREYVIFASRSTFGRVERRRSRTRHPSACARRSPASSSSSSYSSASVSWLRARMMILSSRDRLPRRRSAACQARQLVWDAALASDQSLVTGHTSGFSHPGAPIPHTRRAMAHSWLVGPQYLFVRCHHSIFQLTFFLIQ
jgi:hypothetical protein